MTHVTTEADTGVGFPDGPQFALPGREKLLTEYMKARDAAEALFYAEADAGITARQRRNTRETHSSIGQPMADEEQYHETFGRRS